MRIHILTYLFGLNKNSIVVFDTVQLFGENFHFTKTQKSFRFGFFDVLTEKKAKKASLSQRVSGIFGIAK